MGVKTFFWMRLAQHGSQSTITAGVQRCAVWLPVRAVKQFQHLNP